MTSNPSTVWGEVVMDALAAAGVGTVVIAPGSRSTPLVIAASDHEAIDVCSIIDERSAAYFAVGRAKRTGGPVVVVCTSGTAGANMHPAVIEADRSRTPMIVCTADRPADLLEAGANQTVDQSDLFGDAVRYAPTIPPASSHPRAIDALSTTVTMAVRRSNDPLPGPVHLNIPFRKPLSPTSPVSMEHFPDPDDRSSVSTTAAEIAPTEASIDTVRRRVAGATRPLIVAGPLSPGKGEPVRSLAAALDAPLLADPLSGLRYGASGGTHIVGGYDAFLDPAHLEDWPTPDLVLRFGARPTSVHLLEYLQQHEGEHLLIDPGAEYRDPRFSTTMVVPADPGRVNTTLSRGSLASPPSEGWCECFETAERRYWQYVDAHQAELPPEGRIAHRTIADAPRGGTVFVSSSMPIRDVDRFGAPRDGELTVLGNRGASGIDGITSSALGAAHGSDGHAILLTGDLAFYHDMNGLLALDRCDVDATIVVVNNDGGGIFHKLPIADRDPPFTDQFLTPHGLDFERVADLYGLAYRRIDPDAFSDVYTDLVREQETCVIDVPVDGADNHARRDAFQDVIREELADLERGPDHL